MSLPPILQNLRLPVIGAPLFIVSTPELVIARCIHLIAVADLDEDVARAVFTGFCERQFQTLRAPMRPHEAWPALGDALFGRG